MFRFNQCLSLDTSASPSITMSKRKMCPASQLTSKKKQSTGSSAVRSEMEELLISRDTPLFSDGVVSMLFGINLAVGAISKGQEVLLDKIESIAQKVEILSKEVQSMKEQHQVNPVMNLESPSWLPSNSEIKEWLNSPIPSPERMSFPDLTCSETLWPSNLQLKDPISEFNGFMAHQEQENQDWPTVLFQKPM
ncbi:MAG: hypothetical protein [Acamarivirus nebulais]|uniref:Uncharacterized protein n=1 Tax=Cressdnaviricota sp. TaxID=2748378 RepID=A0A345MUR3_9VIRU|nr:MAG: hypothetical protein [Cressdnaviricota sp.]